MSTPWANYDGIVDFLRDLIEVQKASFSDAAFEINKKYETSFSRMACIGKARRNGIVVSAEQQKFRHKKPQRKQAYNGGLMRALIAKSVRVDPPPLPVIIMDDDIPIEQRKTIFELNSDTCRWPCGEGAAMFFCGAVPLQGCPYCAGHSARAYKGNNYSPSNVARLKRAA